MRTFFLQYITLCLLLCNSIAVVYPQDATVKKMLKQANGYFDAYAYEQAIPIYRDILLRDNLFEVKLKLAEAYRFINDYDKAEYWYRQIIAQLPADQPVHKLNFARVLQSNGNCGEAKKWFVEYGRSDALGTELAKGCDMVEQLNEHAYDYEVWLLPLNTKYAEFAPVLFNDGILFSSNRQDIMKGKPAKGKKDAANQYLDLYYSKRQPGNAYTPPQALKGGVNSQFNDGPMSVCTFPDTTAIFTRNAFFNGKKQRSETGALLLSLYTAKYLPDGKWTNVGKFKYNNVEDELDNTRTYSMTHPSISDDGQTLYFVSDMEGGFGGTDIYLCTRLDSTWSRPVNLGPQVNTAGNELFPYIHADGTLYFASNGHPGLGGLDIFYTNYGRKTWIEPVNMGAPFNSNRDDFGLALSPDKQWGYFTSNRPGGFGSDDIYFFSSLPAEDAAGQDAKESVAFQQPAITNTLLNEALGMNKIRFKPGDWNLTSDAGKELDKLVNYMNDWPEIRVEIGAHTDARGNDFANMEISIKRAEAVREYLMLKGISPARVMTKGYGEQQLLNHCANGVECPDELHQQNDRIEVKVIFIQGVAGLSVPQQTEMPAEQPAQPENQPVLVAPVAVPELEESVLPPQGATYSYKVFIGPYKNVDNDTYYTFAELNTAIDLQYTPEGMMIVLGPYASIAESEEFEKLAKERGAKKTRITVYSGSEPSSMTVKQLKKMGVK
ncbi:hypothetical protein C7N43_33630 [Sphingobacteriales bacterium UPWRP_1]|nr:hypothetical protein B6N25_12655 [Sphingobacteriales bacterium TSM_CSS]PSJ72563.1 hypothetical protein C7N43_33630 [Sphingobacteriales bacterium UPWRP_1]